MASNVRIGLSLRRAARIAARAPAGRLALALLAAGVALGMGAPVASAVIVHLANGKTLSYQPLRGQGTLRPFDAFFSNLDYSGGPVMASNTNYAVYWEPPGAPSYPSDYQPGVNQYLTDLAHDSGGHQNTDSVSAQYNDAAGEFANYNSHFGGALIDTDPYPANGCNQATICLTDAQLRAELSKYVKAQGLPTDLAHEYFLLTPPKVEDCFEASGLECSAGSKAPAYCAYHSNVAVSGGGELIYSNDPYVTGIFGCDPFDYPNGTTSDGVLNGLSHEHNESITDPEPNNAWTDFGGSGGEIGDKCHTGSYGSEFGAPIGTTSNRYLYNQIINGHFYWYQQEWSNQRNQCLQRFTPSGTLPTAKFTTSRNGLTLSFDASGSSATGGVVEYNWQFNDGPGHTPTKPEEKTVPTVEHTFPTAGAYTVALTVFAKDGTSDGTALVVGAPPHWYRNGVILAEGIRLPTISWGTLKLTNSTLGEVECDNVSGGYAENPKGGGAAVGKVQAFYPYECVAEGCKASGGAGIEVTAEKLPWSSESTEPEAGTFRMNTGNRTKGPGAVFIRVNCIGAIDAQFFGENAPKVLNNGIAIGALPSEAEFGQPGSGELESETLGGAKIEGRLKTEGFGRQELIEVKSP